MVRFAANLLLTGIAIALLGVLVLLSTTSDDGVRRRADVNLRQLRDITAAIEREVLNARNPQVDNDAKLRKLGHTLHAGVEAIGPDLHQLFPAEPRGLARARAITEAAFNSIDPRSPERTGSDALLREYAALNQSAARLGARIDGFRENQTQYVALRSTLTTDGRAFVKRLRERGSPMLADSIFRGIQQVLERTERGSDSDLVQIETIANRISADSDIGSSDERNFVALIEAMRALVPVRRAIESNLGEILTGRFQSQVMNLRELVTRDTLHSLTTINDSRVVLNVYTVLLLIVLGYFGIRLQMSYRALNLSHVDLAIANTSLEARVTERTRDLESAYDELKESQVQLVQAEKMSSLGQLVAGIVHEINTPLLYVLNNATVTAENVEELRECTMNATGLVEAIDRGGEQAPEAREALRRLTDSIDPVALKETIDEIVALANDSTEGLKQIGELVQSLKDFSRLDRAAEDLFDIHEGIEKTLLITRSLLKYGVTLERRLGDVPRILCAPSQINQVFINLVTNAVHAMDGKGTLTITTKARAGWVDIEVRDTGCGIPPENIDKIMDPFFTTKPVGKGTGLGLSIVGRIVNEHGGRIGIESKVGVGTRVTISLPIDHGSKKVDAHATTNADAQAA